MIRKMIAVQLFVVAGAFAQSATLEKAPVLQPGAVGQCAAGSTWAGSAGLQQGFVGCVDSQGKMHGNTTFVYADGKVQDVGVMNHGARTGLWKHFDRQGNKIGETRFVNDSFDGTRVTFHINGQVRSVDNWSRGQRVGERQYFDMNGRQVASYTQADGKE